MKALRDTFNLIDESQPQEDIEERKMDVHNEDDIDTKLAEGHSKVMDKINQLLCAFIREKAIMESKVFKIDSTIAQTQSKLNNARDIIQSIQDQF